MKPASPRILTINGGSSSIKFALFEAGDLLRRILEGAIERIGLPEAALRVKGLNQSDNFSRLVTAPDHTAAVAALMDWIEERGGRDGLTAVGRRIAAIEEMQAEVLAWENLRNNRGAIIDWQFTTADARIKLKRLYPTLGN